MCRQRRQRRRASPSSAPTSAASETSTSATPAPSATHGWAPRRSPLHTPSRPCCPRHPLRSERPATCGTRVPCAFVRSNGTGLSSPDSPCSDTCNCCLLLRIQGPREDAGVVSKDNPGEASAGYAWARSAGACVAVGGTCSGTCVVMRLHARRTGVGLVQRIFNYVHKHGSSRTVVMASGVRTSAGDFRRHPLQLSSVRCWIIHRSAPCSACMVHASAAARVLPAWMAFCGLRGVDRGGIRRGI